MKEIIVDTASHNPEILGGGFFGLLGIWLLVKKFAVKSAIETTNLSAADAYTEVIDALRKEVKRLSEVNCELAETLNQIQRENIELRTEVASMKELLAKMEKKFN